MERVHALEEEGGSYLCMILMIRKHFPSKINKEKEKEKKQNKTKAFLSR